MMVKVRPFPMVIAATLLLAAGGTAHATRPGEAPAMGSVSAKGPIWSTARGALPEPRDWTCDNVRPEYDQWLRSGRRARDWRHVGKLYRADSTGEYYTWNDWVEWSRTTPCGSWGMTAADSEALGGAIWLTGIVLLFVKMGLGPDSPG